MAAEPLDDVHVTPTPNHGAASQETDSASGPDASGVNRPVTDRRIDAAQENSGIIVGTRAGTEQSTQTAFIKVYQDAGVIGVAMITLLALCLLLAAFCSRLIKMYSSLTESRDQLEQLRSQAIERLATATLLVKSEFGVAVTEIRREHQEHMTFVTNLRNEASRAMAGADRAYESIEEITRILRDANLAAEIRNSRPRLRDGEQ